MWHFYHSLCAVYEEVVCKSTFAKADVCHSALQMRPGKLKQFYPDLLHCLIAVKMDLVIKTVLRREKKTSIYRIFPVVFIYCSNLSLGKFRPLSSEQDFKMETRGGTNVAFHLFVLGSGKF